MYILNIMRTLLLSVLFSGMLLSVPQTLQAGPLEQKLSKMVKELSAAIAAKAPGLDTSAIAVFPFQADEALTKKRVNTAVSELLSGRFLRETTFRVVERSELDKVFAEQKLALSGAVENETAAQVGRLLGAQFAVLGDVSRIGKHYQVSVKMVGSSTAEIAAMSIFEVETAVFDEEAGRYLALTPEEQKIGLYLFGCYGPGLTGDAAQNTRLGVTLTPTNQPMLFFAVGIGARYWQWRRWMFDFSFPPWAVLTENINKSREDIPAFALSGAADPGGVPANSVRLLMCRLSLNRVFELSRIFHAHAGAGANIARLSWLDEDSRKTIGDIEVFTECQQFMYVAPFIRLGIEWKQKARDGVALFFNANLLRKRHDLVTEFRNISTGEKATVTSAQAIFPLFFGEFSVAFYF